MTRIVVTISIAILLMPVAWGVLTYRTVDTCMMLKRELLSQISDVAPANESSAYARTGMLIGLALSENYLDSELSHRSWVDCAVGLWRLKTRSIGDFEESVKIDSPVEYSAKKSKYYQTLRAEWNVSKSVNPIDDTPTVVAMLSGELVPDTYPVKPKLFLRCKSDRTEAFISYDNYLGNDGSLQSQYKLVTVRFDRNDATNERWPVSTDGDAVFAPKAIGFAKKIVSSSKLIVEITPFGRNPVVTSFDLSQAPEAVAQVAGSCNWTFAFSD